MTTSVDVLVVGGGPAGSTAALSLARSGFSVLVVEREPAPDGEAHERLEPALREARAARGPVLGESLPGIAQVVLGELGLWERFQASSQLRTHLSRSAWGSGQATERHALSGRYGAAFHVHRPSFDALLAGSALAAGARFHWQTRTAQLDWHAASRNFQAVLSSAEQATQVVARYVIDATGRSAWASRRLGASRRSVAPLVGIARCFDHPQLEPSVLIESTPSGWWYSTPTPSGGALALFVTEGGTPAAHAARSAVWRECLELAPHHRARLENATSLGPGRTFAASPGLTRWDPNLPLLPVGDAAAAFDPISGDGLVFALRSALEATRVLEAARTGHGQLFADYQAGVARVLGQHLDRRAEIYAFERRWPASAFWSRAAVRRPDVPHSPRRAG